MQTKNTLLKVLPPLKYINLIHQLLNHTIFMHSKAFELLIIFIYSTYYMSIISPLFMLTPM